MLLVEMCITSFSTAISAFTGTHAKLKMESYSTRYLMSTLLFFTSMKTIFANLCSCEPQLSKGVLNSPRFFGNFTRTFSPTKISYSSREFQLWLASGMTAPAGSLLSQMM